MPFSLAEGRRAACSFPKQTHLQHFQFESKYYLRFGIQQQTSFESLIPAPDVWGCWDLELIYSATCNFHSDVLSAFPFAISYGLEGCRQCNAESQSLCTAFLGNLSFSFSCFFFFSSIFILLLFPSYGYLCAEKIAQSKKL